MRLKDKVAIVTGASQGLGEYLSVELAAEGARVVLAARNKDRLAEIQQRIEASGGTALAVPADIQKEDDCRKLIEAAVSSFGQIDILVLNAGFATLGKLEELKTFDPIQDSMAINFFGAAYPTYLAMQQLIASKGVIAYVTSGSGHLPMAGYLGYSTSKHAMNGFFECLRLEMYSHDVCVLGINPGDMYNDDGAGRTVFGPDGEEHKVDLSIKRKNDIPRVPASAVAKKCLEAIVDRRRTLDCSPLLQKVVSRLRPLAPDFVDRRLYARVTKMRSAFTSILEK